ncbi:MAG: ABC transporter ATP-binding protein [Helicobacter sp.]|nr:ABC transporter ATP-binding protein [Helicobacter sp.]
MRHFYKRFWPYIRNYKFYFVIVVLSTILVGISTASVAYLIKPVLDGIFIRHDSRLLLLVPFLLILAYVGKGVGILIQTYFMNYIGLSIVKTIRNNMIQKMLDLEIAFFNQMRNGELISRITNDISIVRNGVSNFFAQGLQEIFTALALVVVVIYQSPRLALFGLIIMPLSIYPLKLVLNKIKKLSRSSQEKNSDITAKLSEIFNNIEIIKASNGEAIEAKNFAKENEHFFKITLKAIFLDRTNGPIMEFLGAIAMGIVIFLGGSRVMQADLSPGEFFSFMTALFMLYSPIKRLVGMVSAFQEAGVAGERIFEILDKTPAIKDGSKELNLGVKSIEFQNVSLRYNEITALDGVNIDAKTNEVIAFVGKSGGGKTSAINLILRLFDPTSGQILINGINSSDLSQKSLRDKISLVSQRIFIFNDSVLANVAYGQEINEERAIWALKEASAYDFVMNLEGGLYANLDEFGTNLSGGQRQRIAIARALYKNPSVLILDEATSALDLDTETLIKQTINKNKADKIVILIAHRPSTIELANKIYEFNSGKIKRIK